MSDSENTEKHEKTADEVILNPEYLRKIRQRFEHDKRFRSISDEVLEDMFKDRNSLRNIMAFFMEEDSGNSITPIISIKQVVDRRGRTRFVPFFGIKGSF